MSFINIIVYKTIHVNGLKLSWSSNAAKSDYCLINLINAAKSDYSYCAQKHNIEIQK